MKWKKTQSSSTFEKWEISREGAFGQKVRGNITLIKMTGYPRIRYGITAKAYKTKPIGLTKGDEALTKVLKDRTFILHTYKGALKKVKKLQKEIGRLI